ncbi:MAG: YicC family protein [Treponema sp.]|jgi:uncharacterized protein (TIGR00255 family)|nr:YicC family protein [Treponema sp.]
MKSMTGYGSGDFRNAQVSLSVEIKGYNNRFLDIGVYLPPFLSSVENRVREYLAGRFSRGKIEASLRFKEQNAPIAVQVNREAVKAYKEAIAALAGEMGLNEKPSLSLLLSLDGVLEAEKTRDSGQYWPFIEKALAEAADQFEAERVREGKHTEADIQSHLSKIETLAGAVAAHIPRIEAEFQENLRARFRELLGDQIDENRVLAETAVLLVKNTISEELSRLKAHLGEFRAEIGRNPGPGKKLDFLCQEINREINTIGSKTPDLDTSRAVVDMKDALENIREQLRNVE